MAGLPALVVVAGVLVWALGEVRRRRIRMLYAAGAAAGVQADAGGGAPGVGGAARRGPAKGGAGKSGGGKSGGAAGGEAS